MLALPPHRAPSRARARYRARRRPPFSSSSSSSFLLRMLGQIHPPAILANSLDLQSRTTTTTRRSTSTIARKTPQRGFRISPSLSLSPRVRRDALLTSRRAVPACYRGDEIPKQPSSRFRTKFPRFGLSFTPAISIHPFSILANRLDPQSATNDDEHDCEKDRIMPQRGFRTQPRVSTLGTPPKGMRPHKAHECAFHEKHPVLRVGDAEGAQDRAY
jgi:hypothetical protein